MPREMRYRWPVETCSRIDIDCIDHIFGIFGSIRLVRGLILAGWGEKQASIRGKCQPSEKGGASLVPVDSCVLDSGTPHQERVWRLLHW